MTRTQIIETHTQSVIDRNKTYSLHALPDGGYSDIDAEEYCNRMEREISILGQVHNPRISAKSRAALNLNN